MIVLKRLGKIEITSFGLHILAMSFMLCDHLWGTIVSGNEWLTCIGRISFPIFSFLIVEGYFHTRNYRNYLLRIFIFALISEIPFNLMMGSRLFYPVHQNVLWSFLVSLLLIHYNQKARNSGKILRQILICCFSIALGFVLGLLTMVDFYHAGIFTVLTFYFLRGRKWWNYLGQLICLSYINTEILGGLVYELSVFGFDFTIHQQSFALLALIPIWLYQGKQGYYSKPVRWFYYAFYPAHLLILGLLKML